MMCFKKYNLAGNLSTDMPFCVSLCEVLNCAKVHTLIESSGVIGIMPLKHT